VLTPVAHGGDLVCVLCIALLWDLIETASGKPTTLKQYENVDNLKGNERKKKRQISETQRYKFSSRRNLNARGEQQKEHDQSTIDER